ncbi:MAG: hypothetical protein MUF45_18395, partial [Spirosomaceae bacterium]|nr:hypothetical protein [Spirosomataceae bacterium]
QWYKNGRQLVGDTLPFLKVRESGEYSLKMKVDNKDTECTFSPTFSFSPKPDFTPNIALSYGNNCVVEN